MFWCLYIHVALCIVWAGFADMYLKVEFSQWIQKSHPFLTIHINQHKTFLQTPRLLTWMFAVDPAASPDVTAVLGSVRKPEVSWQNGVFLSRTIQNIHVHHVFCLPGSGKHVATSQQKHDSGLAPRTLHAGGGWYRRYCCSWHWQRDCGKRRYVHVLLVDTYSYIYVWNTFILF